jgi:hypothetical protein
MEGLGVGSIETYEAQVELVIPSLSPTLLAEIQLFTDTIKYR